MAKLSGVLYSMNFSQTSAMVVAYWDMLSGIVQRGVGRGTKNLLARSYVFGLLVGVVWMIVEVVV